MNQFNRYVGKTFLYLSPISVLAIVIAFFTHTNITFESPWQILPVAIIILAWLLSGLYFMLILILSSNARETFLVRLANIKERDAKSKL